MKALLSFVLASSLLASCGIWKQKGSDSSSPGGRSSEDANLAAAALTEHERAYLLMEAPAGLTASLANNFVAKASPGQIEALRRAVQADGNKIVIPAQTYAFMPDLTASGGSSVQGQPSSTTAVPATCPSGDGVKAANCSFFGDSGCGRDKTVGSACGEAGAGRCEALPDSAVTVGWWCSSSSYVPCACRT